MNACDPRDALIPGPWGIEDIRKDQSEMTTEAENMLALPYGKKYSAAYYSPFTSFAIARESEMVRMAYDSIRDKIREVKSQPVFREFDAIPLEGQLAVLDLAYQGGAKGIAVNYRSGAFGKAVSERRWYRAAKLCPGPEDMWPPKERQELRRKWLMEAFKKDPKTAAEDRQEYATDLEKFQNTA